ncbi:MAG: serine/threonine protein kinase [Archangiaceae bacterium]|nr:serine/threonine protein kinase [Archangiaceae bacterium]
MSLENFGKYQLIKKLASGGMASIYLARQQGLEGFEKLLVVKRILPHLAENDDFIKMFLDEARIAARLNHPNIVQIFDLGAEADSFFIAMEYIHGEDVRRVWKKADAAGKPIPIPLVLRVIMDAASGLHYAHQKTDTAGKPLGIVHRDISPQNILVTFDGGVKVVDFGIAKAADQATVTRSGVLKGKYSYMSPEQASGEKIDHRSDIFALGVVLYELLTGMRLFKRSNDIQTLNAVADCDIAPPSSVNARVPKDLDPVVMKALTKDPKDRYPDAGALEAALEQWLLSNQLASSSGHLATFMKDLYAERLAREAQEGRVLVDELDKSRSPEDPPPRATRNTAAPRPTGASKLDANRSRSGESAEDRLQATRAERSRGPSATPAAIEESDDAPEVRTDSGASVSFGEPSTMARSFPYLWAALLGIVGATFGAWLVLRTNTGGLVRLESDPPGAQVTLDGSLLADLATPCTLPRLAAGTHQVALTKKGFQRLEVQVNVPERGDVTLPPFALVAVAGPSPEPTPPVPAPVPEPARTSVVTVKSTPPGALASVNGEKLGQTPLTLELPVGSNANLKLELAGYKELETTFNVPESGGEQAFALEEKAKKKSDRFGMVRFKVDPWATVECGELKLGDTPFPDKQLPAGTYKCSFSNPDFKKRRFEVVKVEPNALTKVIVKLEE